MDLVVLLLLFILGLVLALGIPVFVLIWVPTKFRKSAGKRTGLSVFALLLLGGITAIQLLLLPPSEFPFALLFAPIGFIELLYLLGWLFWERRTGMSSLKRMTYMLLIYVMLVTNIVVAWMVLPKLVSPSVRAHIAHAVSDLRNLGLALEAYSLDHGVYPPAVDAKGKMVLFDLKRGTASSGYVSPFLTTPIAYLSELPDDVLAKKTKMGWPPYRYATNGTGCFILVSDGPDHDADVPLEEYVAPNGAERSYRMFLSHFGAGNAIEYDATNGIVSSGDIIRGGP